jgi:hypothetical protein
VQQTRRRACVFLAGTQELHGTAMVGNTGPARKPVGGFEDDPVDGVAGTCGSQPLDGGLHLRDRMVPRRRIGACTELIGL